VRAFEIFGLGGVIELLEGMGDWVVGFTIVEGCVVVVGCVEKCVGLGA